MPAQWEAKQNELDYKLKLLEEYNKLKESGRGDEWIASAFPEMTVFMKKKGNSSTTEKKDKDNFQPGDKTIRNAPK
jgi:hypothetical protein